MKRKTVKRSRKRNWQLYLGLVVLVVVMAVLFALPLQGVIDRQRAEEAYCLAQKNVHPIRFIISNYYSKPIWVNIEYSIPRLPTETWMIPAGERDVVYTNQKFNLGQNVTIKFRAVDPDTRRFLTDAPVVIPLPTKVVDDPDYQSHVMEAQPVAVITTATINWNCLTEQVFDGPVIPFGLS